MTTSAKSTKQSDFRSINVRMASRDKEMAEGIFKKLGLTPTEAIRLFYRQTINNRGIPFGLSLPEETVVAMRAAENGTVEDISLNELKSEIDAIDSTNGNL